MEISLLNTKFEEIEKITAPVSLEPEVIHVPVVHQVVKGVLASRRHGNACTKTRSQVRGGGAKPFKQKGTGRARQGSKRSPLMVGGGVTFGPQQRSFEQKMNKRMVLKAIQAVLADKYQAGKLTVVERIESNGKTKEIYKLLNERGLLPSLVVTADKSSPALRAIRNLREGKGVSVEGFSVYDAVKYENLIIEKEALEGLWKRLKK